MNAEQLYALLPAVHRIADEKAGSPLRVFIELFARELEVLSASLDDLYDDQFIETCAPWAAPYIGQLIGWRPLRDDVSPGAAGLNSPRADIGNTIALRRRKGTALMLEELASNLTGWPAHAAECFEQLATTQHMNHVRLHAPASTAVRALPALLARRHERGAFNRLAHSVDVRRIEAGSRHAGSSARLHIPNVALFLWRVRPQRLLNLPLTPDPADSSGTRFFLHPLAIEQPLLRRPQPQGDIGTLAQPQHVPARLAIRELARAWHGGPTAQATLDYGSGRSLVFSRGGAVLPLHPLAGHRIRAADLRDVRDASGTLLGWAHEGQLLAEDIAIDPERGRVMLGSAQAARQAGEPLAVSWHYGLLRDIGGGPYSREPAGAGLATQATTSGGVPWQATLDALPAGSARLLIIDSLAHAETPVLRVPAAPAAAPGFMRVLAAAEGTRPVLQAGGDVVLDIAANGTLVLDGLLVSGARLLAPLPASSTDTGARTLLLRECTLLQGLVVEDPSITLRLERCIVRGPLLVHELATATVLDSVLDAQDPQALAYGAAGAGAAFGAPLIIERCTVVGRVASEQLVLASDTLFHAQATATEPPLVARKRQQGCVRHCWLPPGAVTPRRHRCLPDAQHPDVQPRFASLRWGDALYASLLPASGALFTGASSGGEIGVMHALQQPLREANLQLRLAEALRLGLAAGVLHAS
jgi:hypothetical protein